MHFLMLGENQCRSNAGEKQRCFEDLESCPRPFTPPLYGTARSAAVASSESGTQISSFIGLARFVCHPFREGCKKCCKKCVFCQTSLDPHTQRRRRMNKLLVCFRRITMISTMTMMKISTMTMMSCLPMVCVTHSRICPHVSRS